MTLFTGLLLAAAASAAPSRPPAVLAVVNGVPVKRAELMDRAWRQYGTAVLNEAIDAILVRQAAEALGVRADGGEVDARLKAVQGQSADQAAFAQRLAASGTSLEELRAQLAEQVLREALVAKAMGLAVTDAELKAAFEANKDKLAASESVHLRQLVVASEREAADFLIAVRAGADFAKLAGQVSLDASSKGRGGDVGFLARRTLLPEIEKAVFSVKPGELAGPVKTELGYHVIRVEEVRPAKPAVFEEVKAELRKALLGERVNKAWPEYLQGLRAKAKIELGRGR